MSVKLLHEKLNDLNWDLDRVAGILDAELPEYVEPRWEECGCEDTTDYIEHLHGVIDDLVGYMSDAKKELGA